MFCRLSNIDLTTQPIQKDNLTQLPMADDGRTMTFVLDHHVTRPNVDLRMSSQPTSMNHRRPRTSRLHSRWTSTELDQARQPRSNGCTITSAKTTSSETQNEHELHATPLVGRRTKHLSPQDPVDCAKMSHGSFPRLDTRPETQCLFVHRPIVSTLGDACRKIDDLIDEI